MTETFALPTADCDSCDSSQVVYGQLRAGELVYCCIRCDTAVSEPTTILNAEQADEEGYIFERPLPVKGGKRGCRGGACGVQQIED